MNEASRQKKLDRLAGLMESMPMAMPGTDPNDFPEHELTVTQFKALTYLQSGPQRMGDIARYLDLSLSSVTNLVSRLESKDLVGRSHDAHDRRVVTSELTDEGSRVIFWLWRSGERQMLEVANSLDDEDLDVLVNAFEILLNAARRAQTANDEE